jgi:cytoskeleton protein RodZ
MAASDQTAAAAGTPAPAPASLGQRLRDARVAQDLTIEQLATELRIEAKQLAALEEDRLEQIGVPVFVKGYVKQYGQRLGLDVRELLGLYYQQGKLADIEIRPNRTIKLHDERQITAWLLALIVLVAVVVGLAVWWWDGELEGAQPAVTPAPAAAAPADLDRRAPEPAAPPPAPPAAAEDPARAEPAVADPAGLAVASPAAGADVSPAAAAAAGEGAADDERETAIPVATIPLEFTFEAESWAEVTDARGERLLFGLSAAGRRITVRGEPPFAVLLGNASSVRLLVDGEPYAIPTTGREDGLARFSVDIAEE